jgi:hypothetical protein
MGNNITRKRQTTELDDGFSSPVEVLDPAIRRRLVELQQAVENLSQKVAGISTDSVAASAGYDDGEVRRLIAAVNRNHASLMKDLSAAKPPFAFYCAVRNDTGSALNQYEPVVVTGQVFSTGDARLRGFVQVSVDDPGVDDEDAHFVVMTRNVGNGYVGQACFMGGVLCYVIGEVGDEDKVRAKMHPDHTRALTISDTGAAEILWRDTSGAITTEHLALIRFPAGGGGGGTLSDQDPEYLEGTTQAPGTEEEGARIDHQHAINTTLSGKSEGTLAYYGGKGYMKTADGNSGITHFA